MADLENYSFDGRPFLPDALKGEAGKIQKPIPESFKVARTATQAMRQAEATLFAADKVEYAPIMPKGVNPFHFEALKFAVAATLSNQSYQYGTMDKMDKTAPLTGLVTNEESKQCAEASGLTTTRGRIPFMGYIRVTLNDLCRRGFGGATDNNYKKAFEKLIVALDRTPFEYISPDGDSYKGYVCKVMGEYTRKSDGAKEYLLALHPSFSSNIVKGFAVFPQDFTKRLAAAAGKKRRLSRAYFAMAAMLANQDKLKPVTRYLDDILEELGLSENYYRQPDRTEALLRDIFDAMREIKLIHSYSIDTYNTTTRGKKRMAKFTFTLDPDFCKPLP